jgi:rod shape-determining protein MreC
VAIPRPRSTRLLVVVLVSLSLVIITVDYRQGDAGPLAVAGRAVRSALAPLQEAVTSITRPIGDFFSGLVHLPSLQRENEELRRQLEDANTKATDYRKLQEQLAELYALLDLKQTLDPAAVPAVVIANGVSNFEWSITIDKGSDDGIAVDMPVVTGDEDSARLVGHVTAVTSGSATVQLIIDRQSSVYGELSGSGEAGLVTGQGDQDLVMDLIEPGTEIDLTAGPVDVFTQSYRVAGEEGLYPPNLLIGEVSRVFEGTNQLQTSVSVRPAVNFASLTFVLVLQARQQGPGL